MPFQIIRNDITKMKVDAIVNAANRSLLGGGGVDGAIHRAAGPELLQECQGLGGCETGKAKITKAYGLPAKYVIHTVGPRWHGGTHNEPALLASCYRSSLELALQNGCESVAFPLISAGAYRFPKDQALKIAVDNIGSFVLEHDIMVYLLLFGGETVQLGQKLVSDLQEYIDDQYVTDSGYDREREYRRSQINAPCVSQSLKPAAWQPEDYGDTVTEAAHTLPSAVLEPVSSQQKTKKKKASTSFTGLFDINKPKFEPKAEKISATGIPRLDLELDESFQQMLLRKIDESGMTDAECYKKANIDRKLFSKIRSDVHYKPSKPTVVAFAIALKLGLEETQSMLEKAGFALSRSFTFDVIIRYFIEHGNYNIFEINEALFYYDQMTLGV